MADQQRIWDISGQFINERITKENIPEELRGIVSLTLTNLITQTATQAKTIHDANNKIKALEEKLKFQEQRDVVKKAAAHHIQKALAILCVKSGFSITLDIINLENLEKALQSHIKQPWDDDTYAIDIYQELWYAADILNQDKEKKKYRRKINALEKKNDTHGGASQPS